MQALNTVLLTLMQAEYLALVEVLKRYMFTPALMRAAGSI